VKCEIEFMPVGDASKAGDAIVVRYGDENSYELMIIDGGTVDSGNELVAHVRKYFGADCRISHAVLTHADADHAYGMREALSELKVQKLWLHVPWLSAGAALQYFSDKRFSEASLAARIQKEYDLIDEIVTLARKKNVIIEEPFVGVNIGPFRVLSPYRSVYACFLAQFDRTPDPDQKAIEAAGFWIGKQPSSFARALDALVAKAQKFTRETWSGERLKDGGVTAASNESSVVLYGDFECGRILLTGDAGPWALHHAAYSADQAQLPLQDFAFVQIPHHGSRRNVGPTILNRMVGPILPEGSTPKFSAFVSAPKDDDRHPRKIVRNAFIRRGGRVIATQGSTKIFWGGFPVRSDYSTATPLPFSQEVEEYD
jgi:beta-lactamase superfamily II metal-dependent hydrolase